MHRIYIHAHTQMRISISGQNKNNHVEKNNNREKRFLLDFCKKYQMQ